MHTAFLSTELVYLLNMCVETHFITFFDAQVCMFILA